MLTDEQKDTLNTLRAFLIEHKILEPYLSAITDPRTSQGLNRTEIYSSGFTSSFHAWAPSDTYFPIHCEWRTIHYHWAERIGSGYFSLVYTTRDEVVAYLRGSKTLRLLKALRGLHE